MYRHASDALDLEPARCLFVDDDLELVAAAIDLGCQGPWMRRDDNVPGCCRLGGPCRHSAQTADRVVLAPHPGMRRTCLPQPPHAKAGRTGGADDGPDEVHSQ
jgi:hypothetical protein